jgi:flagellar biosynthesis GTPase FlhF
MNEDQLQALLGRVQTLEDQVESSNRLSNTLLKVVLFTSSEDFTLLRKSKLESTIQQSIDLIDILAESNNRSVIKRILAHPLVTTSISLIISISIVVCLQYFNAAELQRDQNQWFHLNGALVFTPLLTTILGLLINQIVASVKYSLSQEDNMLYLKLKQAIDLSAKEERLAREASAEKERLAREASIKSEREDREASAEKERLAREASAEKERLAREASAEKERLVREASIKSEREDREAAITRETESRIKNEQQLENTMNRFRNSFDELARRFDLILNRPQ